MFLKKILPTTVNIVVAPFLLFHIAIIVNFLGHSSKVFYVKQPVVEILLTSLAVLISAFLIFLPVYKLWRMAAEDIKVSRVLLMSIVPVVALGAAMFVALLYTAVSM